MNDTPAMPLESHHSLGCASREVGAVLVEDAVEGLQRPGDPVGPHLGHHELQLRVAVEHAAQQHLPERLAVPEVRRRSRR